LMHVAPGQQLFYYGSRVWPAGVRKQMYDQFGGMPKDLDMAHDYDPKVRCSPSLPRPLALSPRLSYRDACAGRSCTGEARLWVEGTRRARSNADCTTSLGRVVSNVSNVPGSERVFPFSDATVRGLGACSCQKGHRLFTS
jgi:hypothetical protein